jgi:hypothetical protein
MRFAGEAGGSGFDHGLHERRHVGAVQVGDVAGNIEEMALRGKHGLV